MLLLSILYLFQLIEEMCIKGSPSKGGENINNEPNLEIKIQYRYLYSL